MSWGARAPYAPDSMSGATSNFLDPQVHGSGADGDAVVAGPNCAAGDGDASRCLDVDAVGVGAAARRRDLYILYLDVVAVADRNVDVLAVEGCKTTHHHVAAPLERYRLSIHNQFF